MRISNLTRVAVVSAVVANTWSSAAFATQGDAIAACMEKAAASLDFSGTVSTRRADLIIEKSFGTSDTIGKVPNNSQTRFNIGSATKMVTAIAIGRLVDQGVLQFEAPIGRYLAELKPEFATITIAQLLDHTAGLGDYFRPENRAAIDRAHTATDLLPLALASPPAFSPGSKRAYSNSGYVVLGAVIERVSGGSWTNFVQREILDPIGMEDTRFDALGAAAPMSRMSSEGKVDKPQPAPGPQRASPAGGMVSTPSDISRLLSAVFNRHLLSDATLSILLTPRPDPAGGPNTVGYGFVPREKPTPRIGIGGGAPGVNADIAYFPNSGWQLIALSNYDPPVATQMNRVLEQAISSEDVTSACDAALADPKKLAPSPIFVKPGEGPYSLAKPSH